MTVKSASMTTSAKRLATTAEVVERPHARGAAARRQAALTRDERDRPAEDDALHDARADVPHVEDLLRARQIRPAA
jgi:hypothetical protein